MKKIILLSLFSFGLFTLATAQTGPGGVGNSSNNILWLDAAQLNLNDGDPVSTWADISGNGNDAVQNNSANQPYFRASHINNNPSLHFINDGDDYLHLTNHITTGEITTFIVYRKERHNHPNILQLKNHTIRGKNNALSFFYTNKENTLLKDNNTYHIIGMSTTLPSDTGTIKFWRNNNVAAESRSGFVNNSSSSIGAPYGNGWTTYRGHIAEIILFNEELSTAERRIVSEYLGIKYNLTSEGSLYSYKSTHPSNLIGIGQESDGSNTTANDRDKLTIENPTQLGNGEYLFTAHNDSGYTANTDVPPGYTSRWKQTWRVSEVGEVGNLKVTIEIDTDGLGSAGNHVLLVDNDGNFTNGGTHSYNITGSFSSPVSTLEFDGVNLNEGEYFTLAKKMSGIESITDGSWSTPSTWNCECIPTDTNSVSINHSVTIDQNENVLTAELQNFGTIIFTSNDTLFIHGNFENNGSIVAGDGTIAAVGSSVQSFYNSNTNTAALNNLYVNNSSGLNVESGNWSISNNIQVSSGVLKNAGADSIIFISNSTKSSQILPSVSNAFEGDFVVQRFISERNPNYGNISSPVENATFNDLDDDLYLSGTNGPDSNTTVNGTNDIFYSLFSFNSRTDLHDTITDINEPMIPTYGYEVYLISVLVNFNPTVVDFIGTPNSGDQKLTYDNIISKGWNLIGNPYHSHIEFDSLLRPEISNSYYIFNTDNGAYELISGNNKRPIAPSQAFWVFRPGGGGYYITFKEAYKLDNNSNAFYRTKAQSERFDLKLTSQSNQYNQTLYLDFAHSSTNEMDELDIPILHSPIKEAPAIYSKAVNSKEELVVNSLNPSEESQLVPISIYAGETGDYEMSADNLDALYNNYSCVYLKDKETEEAVDLMVEPNYAFEAKAGKSDRFHLILSNSYEECQEMIKKGEFKQKLDTKVSLRNAYEQWYLDYTLGEEQTQLEVRIYNMSGQEVKAPQSFEANGAGTYPLQNLNDLDGIYLIQVIGKDVFLNKQVKL